MLGVDQPVRQLSAERLLVAQRVPEAADELQLLRRLGQRVLLLDEGTFQTLLGVAQPAEERRGSTDQRETDVLVLTLVG